MDGIDDASLQEFARTEGRQFRQRLPALNALIRDLDLKAKHLENVAANPRTRLEKDLRSIQAIDDATAKLDRVLDHRLLVDLHVTKQFFIEMRDTGRLQNGQSLARLLSLIKSVLGRLREALAPG